MACSDCDGKAAMPLEKAPDDEDFITGVIEGLPSSSGLGGLSHE